jgi:amidase
MKRDFNLWLKSLGPTAPVKSLTALREWNIAHAKAAPSGSGSRVSTSPMRWTSSGSCAVRGGPQEGSPAQSRKRYRRRAEGQPLDAILTPGGSGAGLAARAGYPIIVVPFGLVPNAPTPPFPSGFDAKPGRSASA